MESTPSGLEWDLFNEKPRLQSMNPLKFAHQAPQFGSRGKAWNGPTLHFTNEVQMGKRKKQRVPEWNYHIK